MKKRLWLCAVATSLGILASPVLAATACQVSYKIDSEWDRNTGFTASVKITNQGDPLNGWKVSWDMPSGQKVTGLWNGKVTQTQAHVEVTNVSWNRKIATGGVIDFGFNGSNTDANDNPTNISVNGVKCAGQDSAPPPPPVVVACTANYKIGQQWWGNGASVDVTIRNSGSALKGWKVAWDMPNGQKVDGAWNAVVTQSQNHVEMRNVDWNRYIASGTDIQFGFNLTHTGVNGIPGNISVNGVLCLGQSAGTPTPTPNPGGTIPAAPSGLSAAVIDNGSVDLAWTDRSGNEQGFRIDRRLTGEAAWTMVAITAANASAYRDAAVAMGKSYEYRVYSINSAGASAAITATATLLTLKRYGEQQYAAQNCSGCHGANGKGGSYALPNYTETQLTSLAGTIAATMPKAGNKCAGNCALATARYLVDVMAVVTPPPPDVCTGIDAAPRPRSLRLLSRQEYQNTVNDLLGLSASLIHLMPVENRVDGFDNYIAHNRMTDLRIESFHAQAQAIATQAVQNSWSKIVPCGTQDTACARQFIQTFGKKAYRRPLTTAEQTDYLGSFGQNAFAAAVEITVRRMLASPHFLYRSELGTLQGDGTYRLTQYETASALSYLFLGSLPDDALFMAADDNLLSTRQQLESQATRLIGLTRTREQIGNFVGGWLLSTSPYTLPNKDGAVYPGYTDEVRRSMSMELINFFNHVALDSTQKFAELFGANYIVGNKSLADFYGVGGSAGSSFTKLPVSDGTRMGILTLGAVLARYANGNESHPFKRGGFFYNRLLCHDLPLPANAGFVPVPKPDPNLTTRQRFDYHSKSGEQCWGCHKFLDPAGFTFENYDGAGQYRATEKGNPIDASGTVLGMETFAEGEQASVGNLTGLSQLVAVSPTASQCVARQYYRYATGRREGDEDACALGNYLQGYSASGYNLKTMLMSIVTSPGFALRRSLNQ